MVRETRHLWVGNLPENVSKERIKEHFNRYGPVQSVKYLPCKDGEGSSPVSAVTVAFMDIKSACKALQSQHKLDERLLKTDFYDPTGSGDSASGSVGPPTPEEKGGGPGGGNTPGAKLELSRSSHYYSSSSSRAPTNRQHPSSRYQEEYRHRPRPGQNRNSSSFNQDSVRSNSSSYRYNYSGWKDSRPRSDQANYNSSDKCDSSSRLVNNSTSKPLKAGDRTGSGASGSTSLLPKKKHRGRRSRSNSSSDSHRSGSGSRSSSSSSSRSSSSGSGGSSKSPSPSRGRLGKGLGNHLPHTEFDKLCTVVVRNLSDRPTENALKEELSREYKKGGCVVRSVRIVEKRSSSGSGSPNRNAIITFSDPADVSKALEDSRNKRIFGSLIDVVKYSAHHDDTRPRDGEMSEFHPKATRTLFVGNISREVAPDEIHKRFKEFGEILEIDIKKPDYALVQFVDIRSVLKAIRAADGELIGGQRVSLRFGLSVATKCVWVDGVAQDVSEKMLQLEFGQYGKIQDLIINRSRGHALVYFDQLKKATIAVSEVRGRSILGSRLMTDYASHECRTAFFEHCKKSGMDIKERSKPWEQDSDLSERRHDKLQRDRSNESRSSGTSRGGGRKRDEFDEELRRFQSERGKIESDTERCFTPPYSSSSRRGVLSGHASRSPSPPRSANLGGPSPSNTRSDRDRAYSDRDSVVSDGSRHGSPVSRDSWRQSRYKPRTQAISPPGDSRSPADQDPESRRKHRYQNGDSGDYRSRGRSSNSSAVPQDPRIDSDQRLDEKKHYNGRGVDSGLSEDTSSGSSGSVPDVDNAKLSGGRSAPGSAHARRSSTDSAVSRDNDTNSRPTSPGHSSQHIPVYTSNSSLLRVVPSLNEVDPTSAAPKTPSSPSSDGSRPGTPLCDENPENLIQSRSQPVAAPVRLSGSGPTHLRSQNSTEPMSLPLPRFAQDRLSTSPGERSSSHRSQSHQVSPREPRSDPAGNNVNMLKSSQTRPELSKLKIVSPTKSNSRDSSNARDPRLISPSLKSPLSVPVPHAASAGKQPSFISPASSADPAAAPSSLSVKVGLPECKPKDPRLGTGLLTVAVPGSGGVASSPASPSPRLSRPRTPPLPADKEHTPTSLLGNKETKAEPVTELSDRLKVFHENYEAWSVLTRQQSTGSSSSGSARLNLDMRPSQPSAIAQQLLSRKSVFDEDSKRLEKTSEPSETESSTSRPSSLSSFNSTSSTPTPSSAGVSSFPKTAESPLLTSDTPVLPLSDPVLQTTGDVHTMPMPPQHNAMSPIKSGTTPKLTPPLPRQNSNLSPVPSSRQFQFPPTTKSSNEDSSRPLPLPSKAGTSATPMTVPIKPLVDKLSKPAAFTKPSATVTPTLKSTERMTASSTKPTVFTTSSTKTVSTATMVPSSQQFKNVEKGEASSTTCSPKPESNVSEAPATTMSSSTSSNDTDSDPNVSSTTGLESKKKLDINKDIKTIKKEFDSLTSFKEKKDIGEELFAPTATIIQQVKPKYGSKIEKKPSHISAKYDIFNTLNDVKKNKDKLTSSKEKKDKLKVKQKYQHNDLKDFLAADNKSTIKKSIPDKKLESTKREEKVETKRRLSNASENEDSEPKAKIPKLKSDSDGESEAKKPKSEPMKPMGRIPKLEKKDDKTRERTESVKSQEMADKDKHKSHLKSKSKHEDRHRHKSTSDKLDDKNRDKHKKKKKEKDKDRDKDKEAKAKLDSSKSRSLSTDEDKHRKRMKKSKDHSKDKERKESKDKSRDKDRKDKHRDKDKERKRRKEEDDRKKLAAEHAARKRKRMEDSSNSDQSNNSSDDENRNFSIFDEPVFDENNPVYFSMYDKVKARRSCVKAKEEEEQKRQEEALRKFAKLKEQRAKREGKIKSAADSDDDSMSGGEEDLDGATAALKDRKKQSFINSSSDSDDEAAREVKQKKKSSPGENRKHSLFKSKRTVVDSSDDDSDDAQKPITSKSLSKIGLDSSDSDNNRSATVDGTSSNKKHSSYLESDSEGSDSKLKSSKTLKSESDHSENSKHSAVAKNKNSKSSVSDFDSEEEDNKSSILSKSKKTNKEKASLVKAEPLSTDSEDEKPDISNFNIKKEIKTEKSSNKAVDVKGKSISSKREKKKVKDESNKEKSLLGQKLKRASLFGTSSEDEANPRNIKPPTPNTNTSKLVARDQASVNNLGKSVKLNIDQVYSDSDNDKMDSPAVESDSSDGIPSRPPTPSFPSVKTEEVKKKSEPSVKDDKLADKEKKIKSDKMFDSLLTINVDCAQTKQTSAKKSPNTKSPGKSGAGGSSLSPGNHRSPMISPSGKPTYLLAHLYDKAASREAEKIHRAQEKEMHKKGTDKMQKDVFKTRKDAVDAKKVDKPSSKAKDEIEVIATKEGNKDAAPDKVPETLCLSETDSDSNESPKKKSPATSSDEILEVKTVPAKPRRSLEAEKEKIKNKLGNRQPSDESTDDGLVIDLDNTKKEQSVFDFNDDSQESESKPALERKPLREVFKTNPKAATTSYASFVAGTLNEASSSPSAGTEFKNVVIVPDDDTPPASNGVEDKDKDDLVILEKPSKDELEMSIASIADKDTMSEADAAAANLLAASNAEADKKRTVISQEETESAVNALLGESFDSFEAEASGQPQVENMDEDVHNVGDDEAAAAVAGLATAMSPGEDWANNPEKQTFKEQTAATDADQKQMDESIENIAAEIRRSSTESIEAVSKDEKPPKPDDKKTVNNEAAEIKKPSPVKMEDRRKSRDVFDFNEEEDAPKPSTATTKITPVPADGVVEEVAKPEVRPAQTRVLPISRAAPTRSSPVSSPSTKVTPVPSSVSPSVMPGESSVSPNTQLRLSIDNDNLSPSIAGASPSSLRSPSQRMRRSTGGNSRESEEESAVTEQKIHMILKQAKQEAERHAAAAAHHKPLANLAIGLIPQSSSNPSELLIDPKTGQAVRLTNASVSAAPTNLTTLTLVTPANRPDNPQPTVLPPRNDGQVRPSVTRMVTAPAAVTTVRPAAPVATTTVQPAAVRMPIQLPTQPLPQGSIMKNKPVLLEQNKPATQVVSSNLPRSVSLPTEPVPMSVANKMTSLPRAPLAPSSSTVTTQSHPVVSTRPQSTAAPQRQVTSTAASNIPAAHKPAVSTPQFLGHEGQRVSLAKREEQELDLKIKDQHLQHQTEPLSLHSPQIRLQPRESREIHRPSSTPQPSQLDKEEKLSPQLSAAQQFAVASSHQSMYDQAAAAGLDARTLDLLRMADYKYRLELTQQLLALGYPEHMVPTYVEKILRDRIIQESVHLPQAARSHEERPGSVPPAVMQHLEDLRLQQQQQQQQRQPLPAHSSDYRSDSPLYAGHVMPHPYAAPPSAHMSDHYRDMLPQPAHHQSTGLRLAPSPASGSADLSRSRPVSPAVTYTPSTEYTLPHLAAYPICWLGTLGLKNEMANVRMHYVSGNRDLARASLPDKGSTLKIMQRMRLEDSQLEGVARKMESKNEHCILLALPNGSEQEEIELQSRMLRHSFITYLQLKSAAGIVNVSNEDNQPAYIVHVFPSCDFANENLARIAPNLLHRVADIEHLVIVIATVFDVNNR